jgi:purine nucleosidase
VDPEAARVVLRSGLPVEMVGWHLCRGEAALNPDDIAHVLALDTDIARFAIECNSRAMEAYREQTGEVGIALPDPTAMCVALDPGVCTSVSRHLVEVETGSELTRGMTVVDRLNVAADERNRGAWSKAIDSGQTAQIVWSIDNARWKRTLYAALA